MWAKIKIFKNKKKYECQQSNKAVNIFHTKTKAGKAFGHSANYMQDSRSKKSTASHTLSKLTTNMALGIGLSAVPADPAPTSMSNI